MPGNGRKMVGKKFMDHASVARATGRFVCHSQWSYVVFFTVLGHKNCAVTILGHRHCTGSTGNVVPLLVVTDQFYFSFSISRSLCFSQRVVGLWIRF